MKGPYPKNMKKLAFFIISLLAVALPCLAGSGPDTMNSGIIYGDNHAFTLSAPDEWVLDNSSGLKQGLHAVFYPKGSSWEKASAVMYANVCVCKKSNQTLQDFIEHELKVFREQDRGNVDMVDGKTLTTQDGRKAVVKHLTGDQYGNYESIAYIEESKVFIMIVLSSKSRKDYESSLHPFQELVKSYFFIAENVKIKN